MQPKTALITGAARRVGAAIGRRLHAGGMNVLLHYRSSATEAENLSRDLNYLRPDSATTLACDLTHTDALEDLVVQAYRRWGRLDALINNASAFMPTPLGNVTEAQWETLLASNLKAPFFLAQAAAPKLRDSHGCIVNIIDIHAEKGLKGFPVYSIAKAGLAAMTRALAKELAPEVRVNGVSPGAILWPEETPDVNQQMEILSRILLKRLGAPEDIAKAVRFLVEEGDYMTGEIITVDGGRSLNY